MAQTHHELKEKTLAQLREIANGTSYWIRTIPSATAVNRSKIAGS